VATPDEVVVHPLKRCGHCQHDLSGVGVAEVVKRQVFDIPPIRLHVTEHQAEVKPCPTCGCQRQAAFPDGVHAPTQYVPNVLAHAVYLHSYHLLPMAHLREWFKDCGGQGLSEGALQRVLERIAGAVAPALDTIYEGMTRSQVVHLDETGFRIANHLRWLDTVSTPMLTYYTVHAKRGDEALLDAGVLPNCQGWAVHDGFKPYFGFETVRHALCNAHHLRELEFLIEQYDVKWAQAMQTLLPHPPNSKTRLAQHPATNMLIRLRDYRAAVLALIRHPQVPFDNNLAERDLRMMKLKQKISGGLPHLGRRRSVCRYPYLSLHRTQAGRLHASGRSPCLARHTLHPGYTPT
jgi:transposase